MRSLLASLLIALLISGCMVGPDYKRPVRCRSHGVPRRVHPKPPKPKLLRWGIKNGGTSSVTSSCNL